MSFPNLTVTDEGKAAMLKVIEGDALEFTRIGLGNGDKPESIDKLTAINNLVCYGTIKSYERNGVNAILHWTLDTASIDSEFYWKEYGLFARNSDGNEFLFSYAYDDDKPQPLSASTSQSLVLIETDINIAIGSAENVSAVIGEYSAYASKEIVEEHISDVDNPHKVTAEQIGLGNVDNVSTDDAVPTIDDDFVPDTLTKIENGDNNKTLWGKVKKGISSLIAHIANKNNPHGVTTDIIGAAAKSHNHSATDINSGVLPVERGGTGANSAANALKMLVTNSEQPLYLALGKYLYGKDSDGNIRRICGANNYGEAFLGNDDTSYTHVHGQNICFKVTSDKYWYINNSGHFYPSSSNSCVGTSSKKINRVYATNSYSTSDRKEKENISDCEIGFNILKKLSYKNFNFLGKEKLNCGLIAQDVFKALQDIGVNNSSVYTVSLKGNNPNTHPELEDLTDEQIKQYPDEQLVWSLDYQQITNYCIAGFITYVNETEKRLSAIEKQLEEIK